MSGHTDQFLRTTLATFMQLKPIYDTQMADERKKKKKRMRSFNFIPGNMIPLFQIQKPTLGDFYQSAEGPDVRAHHLNTRVPGQNSRRRIRKVQSVNHLDRKVISQASCLPVTAASQQTILVMKLFLENGLILLYATNSISLGRVPWIFTFLRCSLPKTNQTNAYVRTRTLKILLHSIHN